jgi:hydrogenase expression/formation protein HypE
MADHPKVGKIDLSTFEALLRTRLGRPDPRVLVGPLTGVDAAVLNLGGQAVVIAEDPIFPAAGLPLETFGWFTMHIGASDVAVMGVRPEFALYSLLMPPGTSREDFDRITESIHQAAMELDIAIIGGHTGYYPVVTVPIIGGITVIGTGDPAQIVTPAGACPGDAVLMTKGPAIEATGLLAVLYESELRAQHGDEIADAALARCGDITVVRDALTARAAGPVSAMHDATEGGVLGGLWEIAEASGVGMDIDEALMPWPPEVEALCGMLAIDPLAAIAEGTLLLTAAEQLVAPVIAALAAEGIPCARIGRVTSDRASRRITRRDGRVQDLAVPAEDPFWPAFFRGVEKLG